MRDGMDSLARLMSMNCAFHKDRVCIFGRPKTMALVIFFGHIKMCERQNVEKREIAISNGCQPDGRRPIFGCHGAYP